MRRALRASIDLGSDRNVASVSEEQAARMLEQVACQAAEAEVGRLRAELQHLRGQWRLSDQVHGASTTAAD